MFKKFRFFARKAHPFCSAVVLAAGASQRMGEDKLFCLLDGVPTIVHTLQAFNRSPYIHEIIVVTRAEKIVDVAKLCRDYGIAKVTKVLCGGSTRLESSLAGVSEISPKAKLAAIHDGARPLVTQKVIEDAIKTASLYKAVAPAIQVKDTVKLAESGIVTETPDRHITMAVQTPQVFAPELIKGALTYALQNELEVTDDCSAVEALGVQVHLCPGSEENIKLTTPLDFELAEAIINSRRRKMV
ncbi:MAG: 2-C-methyl-D-erythritol 4-phosphate cytidylyltransferase [Oscillospiraceae bacterium]|jgi:2-C-methyl-D-erythritol 4-phosphate cytidylyltransferase